VHRKLLKVFLDASTEIAFISMVSIWKSLCILIAIKDFNLIIDWMKRDAPLLVLHILHLELSYAILFNVMIVDILIELNKLTLLNLFIKYMQLRF
jgi:hypothetical protein